MGTNTVDKKWVRPISAENEEEDDEEALSLCDLPINEENQSRKEEEEEAAQSVMKTQEEFDFGSRGGSVLTETEMCAADEVFFQGQILPLRYYVSSETGSAMPQVGIRNPILSSSGSGSIDRSHSSGLTSVSSSSIWSQHSSSSGSRAHEKRLQNQFLSQPSPKPKIRLSNAPYGNVSHQSRPKSTRMSFLRVGLVRTPGIELQHLKLRSNSNRTRTSDCDKNGSKIEKKKKKKKKRRALFHGCKCSVDAVDTVPLMADDMLMISSRRNNNASEVEEKEDEKVQAMKKKKKKTTTMTKKKQATSHRRTCEWLKELSLGGGPDEA